MRALITGKNGFAGTHLAKLLCSRGHETFGLELGGQRVDLADVRSLTGLVNEIKPDLAFHLAAVSGVGASWKDPDAAFAVNVEGTRNLMQAVADEAPAAKLLFVGSGSVYGGPDPSGRPFKEDDPLDPRNPYAKSKAEAEKVCRIFHEERGLDVRIVRPLGHAGPGQRLGFVAPDLASQIARASLAGDKGPFEIEVGSLQVKREFADVRDVVRAYLMIMEKGEPGRTYNLATNEPHSIEEVGLTLIEAAGIDARLKSTMERKRKNDDSTPALDMEKTRALGFDYEIPFHVTMADVLGDWKTKLGEKA